MMRPEELIRNNANESLATLYCLRLGLSECQRERSRLSATQSHLIGFWVVIYNSPKEITLSTLALLLSSIYLKIILHESTCLVNA